MGLTAGVVDYDSVVVGGDWHIVTVKQYMRREPSCALHMITPPRKLRGGRRECCPQGNTGSNYREARCKILAVGGDLRIP